MDAIRLERRRQTAIRKRGRLTIAAEGREMSFVKGIDYDLIQHNDEEMIVE